MLCAIRGGSFAHLMSINPIFTAQVVQGNYIELKRPKLVGGVGELSSHGVA